MTTAICKGALIQVHAWNPQSSLDTDYDIWVDVTRDGMRLKIYRHYYKIDDSTNYPLIATVENGVFESREMNSEEILEVAFVLASAVGSLSGVIV